MDYFVLVDDLKFVLVMRQNVGKFNGVNIHSVKNSIRWKHLPPYFKQKQAEYSTIYDPKERIVTFLLR